jgi:hypothetical protein
MSTRIGDGHRVITRKDGRTMLVKVEKRRDICAELKRKNSKRVRIARKGRA